MFFQTCCPRRPLARPERDLAKSYERFSLPVVFGVWRVLIHDDNGVLGWFGPGLTKTLMGCCTLHPPWMDEDFTSAIQSVQFLIPVFDSVTFASMNQWVCAIAKWVWKYLYPDKSWIRIYQLRFHGSAISNLQCFRRSWFGKSARNDKTNITTYGFQRFQMVEIAFG
jgi:hypothetical protein